jgi:polyisoprenoid-binding protein YceI
MTDNLRTQTDIRPGNYLVDPIRSAVRFTATHVFGLKPVDGTMTVRSGTVMVADEPRRSTVSAELDAGSFTTDDERRNKDVRGRRFLDAANHPTIGFRSTRVAYGDGGPQIIGVLSVRGGSAEVTLAVTEMAPTVDGYRIMATASVDRVAAGVTAGRALIGRCVSVTLTLYVTAD